MKMLRNRRTVRNNFYDYFAEEFVETNYFEEGVIQRSGEPMLTKEQFDIIIDTMYHLIAYKLSHEGRALKLPNLGYIQVYRRKSKAHRGRKFNYGLKMAEGISSRFQNRHTGGDYTKTIWNKQDQRIGLSNLFKFKTHQHFRSLIHENIMEGGGIQKYIKKLN